LLLGDVIQRLTDEASAVEVLLGLGDLKLLAEMQARAEENGMSLGGYAAWAVRVYANNASSDEWTTLIGAMGRSGDPGATCLNRAFTFAAKFEAGPPHAALRA
jgi:hypothetical protein